MTVSGLRRSSIDRIVGAVVQSLTERLFSVLPKMLAIVICISQAMRHINWSVVYLNGCSKKLCSCKEIELASQGLYTGLSAGRHGQLQAQKEGDRG